MAALAKLVVPHLKKLLPVIFLFLILSVSPLVLAFYVLSWIRAKLTALVYSNVDQSFMTSNDAAAGMEFNSKNSIINVVTIINHRLPLEDMKDLMMKKVIKPKDSKNKPLFPKLTHCFTLRAGYLFWSEENNFDIDDHIRQFHGQLPPIDEAQLKSVVNHLCNTPLDLSKPLWEIHVIPTEYRETNVMKTCLLYRVHHSIADGISLYRLLIEQMGGNHGAFQHILERMENRLKSNFKSKFAAALGQFQQMIYAALSTPAYISKVMFSKDHIQHYNTKLSGVNIFDWTSTIKMSTIKDIKNATSTTVNDVIVSCLAGACRKYLLRQGVHPPDFLKSMMAVAFHNQGSIQLRNESMGVLHQLPTGDMDCIQRLQATKSIMEEFKHSPDILFSRWFQKHCANIVPYQITKFIFGSAHFNVLISNLPGPLTKALFNGHVIDSCFGIANTRSSFDFGLIAMSYAGNLTVSLTVDTAIISTKEEAGLILSDFVQEMQNLYHSVISIQSAIPRL